MRYVPFVDLTALHNLKATIESLKAAGLIIMMSGTVDNVYKDLKNNGIIDILGEENIFKEFSMAIEYANNLIKEKNEI
jgi:SulP family sulfate permease